MPEAKALPFTVIARDENSGQILCDHVMADSPLHSFAVAAQTLHSRRLNSVAYIVALPGHACDGEQLFFPGEGEVYASTVLEQDDVFC